MSFGRTTDIQIAPVENSWSDQFVMPESLSVQVAPGQFVATTSVRLVQIGPVLIVGDEPIGIAKVGAGTETAIVELSDSSNKAERFPTPAGPTSAQLPTGASVIYQDHTNTAGGFGHVAVVIKEADGTTKVFSWERDGWVLYDYDEYRHYLDGGDKIIPIRNPTNTIIRIQDGLNFIGTHEGSYGLINNNCGQNACRLLTELTLYPHVTQTRTPGQILIELESQANESIIGPVIDVNRP